MNKDPKILLKHILESIAALEAYLADIDEEEYLSNMEKQDSAERRLQIIGEAVVQLPQEFKDSHPEIEWGKIAGLRNRLVHEYFDIDVVEIYKTVKDDMPDLIRKIESYLENNGKK